MLNSLPNILQFKYVFFLKLQPMTIPLIACFILFSLLPRHFRLLVGILLVLFFWCSALRFQENHRSFPINKRAIVAEH